MKFLAVEQADIGFPSPGVLSFAVNNGMDLVSVYGSANLDLFNIAFRKGEGVTDLTQLAGKTVLLGSAAWQAICDPMSAAVGVDPKTINYVEAGWPTWTTALASGQDDACLASEGLRADLGAKGLDFDYWLGMRGSPLPSNALVVRRADLQDPERLTFLRKYLRGWAMGSEFADRNPRAAAEIVFKALPTTRANFGPRAGTESLIQIHRTFKGDMANRVGWDDHDIADWENVFKILKDIGQSSIDIDTARNVTNDLAAIDMADLEANFYGNVIN